MEKMLKAVVKQITRGKDSITLHLRFRRRSIFSSVKHYFYVRLNRAEAEQLSKVSRGDEVYFSYKDKLIGAPVLHNPLMRCWLSLTT